MNILVSNCTICSTTCVWSINLHLDFHVMCQFYWVKQYKIWNKFTNLHKYLQHTILGNQSNGPGVIRWNSLKFRLWHFLKNIWHKKIGHIKCVLFFSAKFLENTFQPNTHFMNYAQKWFRSSCKVQVIFFSSNCDT